MSSPDRATLAGNQSDPFVDASFHKWAMRAYWTPAEIAALSLGKHPWSLNEERGEAHRDSWISWEFFERDDIFTRAAEKGLISWECSPPKAIEFMKQRGISYPALLEEAVSRLHRLVNWEQAYSDVLAWAKANQLEHQRQLAEYQTALEGVLDDYFNSEAKLKEAIALIKDLIAENAEVTQRLEQMEASVSAPQASETRAANDNDGDLPPKLRKSYEVMIAAMAIFGYGFDPASEKSDIGTDLAGDIAKLGKELTPPVVANHVRACCKRLGITRRPDQAE